MKVGPRMLDCGQPGDRRTAEALPRPKKNREEMHAPAAFELQVLFKVC